MYVTKNRAKYDDHFYIEHQILYWNCVIVFFSFLCVNKNDFGEIIADIEKNRDPPPAI